MPGLMAGMNIDLYIQKCNKITNNQYIMAEVKDGRYLIAKDIPLDPKGETVIKKGREIYLTKATEMVVFLFPIEKGCILVVQSTRRYYSIRVLNLTFLKV